MHNFHPLEVVDRGSETQLQVGENLNKQILFSRTRNNRVFHAEGVLNNLSLSVVANQTQ